MLPPDSLEANLLNCRNDLRVFYFSQAWLNLSHFLEKIWFILFTYLVTQWCGCRNHRVCIKMVGINLKTPIGLWIPVLRSTDRFQGQRTRWANGPFENHDNPYLDMWTAPDVSNGSNNTSARSCHFRVGGFAAGGKSKGQRHCHECITVFPIGKKYSVERNGWAGTHY